MALSQIEFHKKVVYAKIAFFGSFLPELQIAFSVCIAASGVCPSHILYAETDFACRDCYFPLRDGNRVTLFSCARNVDFEHRIPLDAAGSSCCGYSPPSLWIDVFRSIVASERFIYITGWSVHVKIKLLR